MHSAPPLHRFRSASAHRSLARSLTFSWIRPLGIQVLCAWLHAAAVLPALYFSTATHSQPARSHQCPSWCSWRPPRPQAHPMRWTAVRYFSQHGTATAAVHSTPPLHRFHSTSLVQSSESLAAACPPLFSLPNSFPKVSCPASHARLQLSLWLCTQHTAAQHRLPEQFAVCQQPRQRLRHSHQRAAFITCCGISSLSILLTFPAVSAFIFFCCQYCILHTCLHRLSRPVQFGASSLKS